MEPVMRRLLTFACEGESLSATLDEGPGAAGLLIVTGGTQTRIGSHRLFERLSKTLSESGFPSLRFDRRGVGDSSGADPGYEHSRADIAAAAELLRANAPHVERIYGLGLCDGATALALHGQAARLSGLILVNPWFVEAESGSPPAAAIRAHYRRRLMSAEGWKKIFKGNVSIAKLIGGVRKAATSEESSLSADVARSLASASLPITVVLARGDHTAIAAGAELKRDHWKPLLGSVREINTDSHTFAKPGDLKAIETAVFEALSAFEAAA
jgi:exosortase A-associated hydrolase 1